MNQYPVFFDDESHLEQFTRQLTQRVEAAYLEGGYGLGWRLLTSPAKTLLGAKIAFLGLNPGGNTQSSSHDFLTTESGSAFENESWAGAAPGQSRLQKQVRALFSFLNVNPTDVLSGNLVPFRSRNWACLPNKKQALTFSKGLWRDIFAEAQPSLIIAMSKPTINAIMPMLNVNKLKKFPVGWGRITACKGEFERGKFIGLPHLSRFPLFGRAESQETLANLLL